MVIKSKRNAQKINEQPQLNYRKRFGKGERTCKIKGGCLQAHRSRSQYVKCRPR